MPKMKKPKSRRSNVTNHSYNPETKELSVTFHNGRTYTYLDIPKDLADGFENTSSRGGFLHKHIIGTYRFSSSSRKA